MPEVTLSEIVERLNAELRIGEIKDYPNAVNGLQMQNRDDAVKRVIAAVDACEPVVQAAVQRGAELLIVHHGLFWSGLQPLTGAFHRKIALAMDNNLAIYSAHLPLDAHLSLGNNALLAKALGLRNAEPVLPLVDQTPLGFRGKLECSRTEFTALAKQALGVEPHVCPGGPEQVRDVVVLTGGGGGTIADVAELGADTFLTGEGPHWSYTLAEELGVNVLYGGHYATETFGVKALGEWLEREYGLPWEFVDHPTGL